MSKKARIMQPEEYLAHTEILHSSITQALTRFQHLAEVNTPPNHCEISELRSVISESRGHLSELNNILAEMEKTVKTVVLRIGQVACVYESAKKIIHPIRSLPNEILSLIFAQCVDYDDRARDSLSVDQAPWTLSYVCSRWRHLVTSCPSLWTTPCFDFTAYQKDQKCYLHTAYLLALYIERSRALPLDVTLRVMSDYTGHAYLRHVIQATTGRWNSVVLDLPLSEVLRFQACPFPRLKSVKIRDCHSDIENEQDGNVFSSLPVLESLTVTAASSLTLQLFTMPWIQIVDYDCEHDMFSTDNLDVLRQMTALQCLMAHIVVGFSLEAVEPLVLPLLTDLKLFVAGATEPDGINLSAYLAFLQMPLLDDLTLYYCETDASCPVSSHPAFPSVKRLRVHLDLASNSSENFIHFLSLMGGVEELELSGVNISADLIQVLTPSGDGALILPRLRVLDAHNAAYALALDGDPNLQILAFHDMLLSRSRPHERLIFTLQKLVAAPRRGNHQVVVPLLEEISMRWEEVSAAISVTYIESDYTTGVGSGHSPVEDLVEDEDSDDSD